MRDLLARSAAIGPARALVAQVRALSRWRGSGTGTGCRAGRAGTGIGIDSVPPSSKIRLRRSVFRATGRSSSRRSARPRLTRLMAAVVVPPGREPTVAPERAEMARVDAELLNQLLNQAGEVSIARARVEQHLGSVEFNLAELSRTVTRLKEQLHKLEIETETQILHRHEDRVGPAHGIRPAGAGPLFVDPAVLASPGRNGQRRGEHPGAAGITHAGNTGPAAAAGPHDHRAAERPDAHAHGLVPAPCTAPVAHRAPGRDRHRQAGRTGGGGRLRRTGPPGARADAAALRTPAAQRRGPWHRDAGTATRCWQAGSRPDPPDSAPRRCGGHRRRHR